MYEEYEKVPRYIWSLSCSRVCGLVIVWVMVIETIDCAILCVYFYIRFLLTTNFEILLRKNWSSTISLIFPNFNSLGKEDLTEEKKRHTYERV